MSKLFDLKIISLDQTLFRGRVSYLCAPGEAGYLGVLANHAPLITTLVPGRVSYRDKEGKTDIIQVKGGGFLEVKKNKVTVLL